MNSCLTPYILTDEAGSCGLVLLVVPVNEIITAAHAACLIGNDDGSCCCVISKHRRHNAPRIRPHVRCKKGVRNVKA
ncbi:hypothetical protein [Desulfovibrio sp. Huiquan2017]|uniref:hypothetical protein n=1 Tax=Desulfovibrio sp. Huiquan2017 TaxID=2816861 RepID=UPI001A939D1E|nr:hypothetical protein [Desulfovibrio sp. Huiquan2017]